MQHCSRKAPPPCLVHEKFEDSLADASAAQLREYRHSSDLYFDSAVGDKPAAPDRAAVHQGEGVNRVLIVFVQLKLLRMAWASAMRSGDSIATTRATQAMSCS